MFLADLTEDLFGMEQSHITNIVVALFLASCTTPPPVDVQDESLNDSYTAYATPPSPLVPSTPLQIGSVPHDATKVQRTALHWLNTFRIRAGVAPIHQLNTLNTAASSHAAYVLANADLYATGLSVHEQDPEQPGFLGERFWERLAAVGYNGTAFREVVAYHAQPATAIAHWMETIYHRLPLIHPNAQHVGYGEAHLVNDRVNVMDVGAGDGWSPRIPGGVAWPPDGATQVALAWDGLESPQPLSPPNGFPSGPVITLTFPNGTDFAIAEHRLTNMSTGEIIAHVFADQNNDPNLAKESSVAMYANEPLQPAATYSVQMKGVVDGAVFERQWSFSTRAVAQCSVQWQDCGVGKGCYATTDNGATCAWAGARRMGEPCEFQNDCAGGLTCVSSVCRVYCLVDGGDGGCDTKCDAGWSALNVPGGHGVCKL